MNKTALTHACYDSLTTFLSGLLGGALGGHSPGGHLLGGYLKTLNKNKVFGLSAPAEQRAAIRASLISMPADVCQMIPHEVMSMVDELLGAELAAAPVVDALSLPRVAGAAPIAVWQGDMSLLRCDAVVNPGNNALLGCFLPSHKCLDNILHAQAGPRLRIACAQMLQQLGLREDGNGQCRVTPAFALPSRHVFHTVGPCLLAPYPSRAPPRAPTETDRQELRSCYEKCLDTAHTMGLGSIAFCCISTGIFGYPADEAAQIALNTTRQWLETHTDSATNLPLVVFNVFKDEDLAIYQDLAPKVFSA
jgi:O-acetyl-ADP-ribose deacetylase (regulator of RNase III)